MNPATQPTTAQSTAQTSAAQSPAAQTATQRTAQTTAAPAHPRPQVGPPADWAFPEPTRSTLSNGLRVMAFDLPGQHVLSVHLGLPAPLAGEPREVEGVGLILARCLDQGTDRHTAEELAELLSRQGIVLRAGIGERGLVVELDAIARSLPTGLDLLVECLTGASYPDAEVRREVRHRIADIGHDRADPGSRAAMEFIATYFDPQDRASRPSGGSRESMARITPQDVRDYHAATVHPDAATLVIAGDLSGIDTDTLLEQALGRWPRRGDHAVPTGDPGTRAEDAGRLVFVDRPGAVQTEVYVGGPGPRRSDPLGWGPYQALSFAMGGSPQARIDRVLREERGYTYGIRAGFRPRAHGGLFVAAGSVRGEVTAEALEALLEILDLSGEDLTDAEIRHAAGYQARTAPGRYADCDTVAAEALALALDGTGPEFVTETVRALRTLDPQTAREAWDRHRGTPWTVVLVGDAERHADRVADLGRGAVTVLDQSPRPSAIPTRTEV